MTEKFVNYVVEKTREEASKILTDLGATRPLIAKTFPRISVQDLHQLVKKETGGDYTKHLDLVPAEEKFICEYAAKTWKSDFVIVDGFPRSDAKFYHHQNEKNPQIADRADLIFR